MALEFSSVQLPDYLPFRKLPGSMGLKALAEADWLDITAEFAEELALKRQLLGDRYEQVFAAYPESLPPQQEALAMLLEHLDKYYAPDYQITPTKITNNRTGEVWQFDDFAHAPLELMGRLVQEDFTILQPLPQGYTLTAATVCFPLRWDLRSKMGLALSAIHQPVPDYAQKLSQPVDNMFAKLKAGYPLWRMNWSIVDSPELFLVEARNKQEIDQAITPENAGSKLWLRMERQTMHRLAASDSVLFTVHTYRYPLAMVHQSAEIAADLVRAIEQMSPHLQSYKNLLPIRDTVIKYLVSA
jgi:hypothetical protein